MARATERPPTTDHSDCNDDNVAINPLANEICNAVDDNCNDQVDDGLTTVDYYPDVDMDFYGNINAAPSAVCAERQPVGSVVDHSDCADTDAAIHPSATELCDHIDNNCNLATDEGFTYYGAEIGATCDSDSDTDQCARGQVDCLDLTNATCANDPPSPERCDSANMDDNCDGLADRAVFAELESPCGIAGTCSEGVMRCSVNGLGTECAVTAKGPEICGNAIDDDCDHQTDELSDIVWQGLHYNDFCDGDDDDLCFNGVVKCIDQEPGCLGDVNQVEWCDDEVDDDCDGDVEEFNCEFRPTDAGPSPDAGDAGARDGSAVDAGTTDGAPADSGSLDGSAADAGLDAAAAMDSALPSPDAALPDAADPDDAGENAADGALAGDGSSWPTGDAAENEPGPGAPCLCAGAGSGGVQVSLLMGLMLLFSLRARSPRR
jgi:hypothetical protein